MILLNSLIEVKTEGQTGRAGRVPLTFVLQVRMIEGGRRRRKRRRRRRRRWWRRRRKVYRGGRFILS